MSKECEFKVGDSIKNCQAGLHGIVVGFVGNRHVQIKAPEADIYTTWDIADCEIVKAYDRRMAFLTRLQSLLREFDAFFMFGLDNNGRPSIGIKTGDKFIIARADKDEKGDYEDIWITANNIMDFDKE
ncbi:MAG: hypothetical protein HDT00_00250 [Bacteroidales bacterium]|nr:hypothetical protein [Bacteroidales bacterium]